MSAAAWHRVLVVPRYCCFWRRSRAAPNPRTLASPARPTGQARLPFPLFRPVQARLPKMLPSSSRKPRSGLRYRILRAGKGPMPKATDTVKVNYHGWLDDGKVFDSSYDRNKPISFPLNGVIPGWTEGMQLVGEGRHDRIGNPFVAGLRRSRHARRDSRRGKAPLLGGTVENRVEPGSRYLTGWRTLKTPTTRPAARTRNIQVLL